ncbi:MAG TPA: hypothetical protein VLU95_04505 [Candidatus Acidoferrum sp.]|nr:hypothetical protein [Candidatus Acidoferrum sp.]
MNWKNVLYLLRVDRKSGRLIRGIKATRYKENSFLAYWPYWVAAIIGVLGGLLANYVASIAYSQGVTTGLPSLGQASLSFFIVLPTLILIASLVFTLLQQIQIAGLKPSAQVMYALPVTWQEHTLASILSNLLGWPIALVTGLSAGVIVFSVFNGLILQALLTTVIMAAAAFMASSITEILRIIQVRFTGAVYKSSGRGAIWVRLIGTLLFFIVFYIFYFYVINGFSSFITNLTAAQNAAWFVPFIWLALLLSYAVKGLVLQVILFTVLSSLFIAVLYYLAVALNERFGFYEPPAITIQKSGFYEPKTGLLGKIGFSDVEAAIIRKDLRAFTRRRELIGVYIAPIIMIIIPIMNSLGVINQGAPTGQATLIFSGIIYLLPAAFMAMLLGEVLIGEEGQSVWRIYASPISAKNLVKSKYFFTVLFSTILLLISGTIGTVFYHPTIEDAIIGFLETFLVVLAVGAVSLAVGFKGPDFSQTRRARMIRQEWSLVGLVVGALIGAAVVAPLLPFVIISFLGGSAFYSLIVGVLISAIISLVISAIFYKINIGLASDLLKKAET